MKNKNIKPCEKYLHEKKNHKNWFENPHFEIMSQILNNLDLIHTWIDSKLKHNYLC